MNAETNSHQRIVCPNCGKKGKKVSPVTVSALLKDEFAQSFPSPQEAGDCCHSKQGGCANNKKETNWRFCDSKECDVVYFSEIDETVFHKSQLRVAVGVKETEGERPLCYCFGHSIASIKEELVSKGHSDVPEDIRVKMKNPGCHCETSNPSGSCCLGNVARGIQIAKDELGMEETAQTVPASSSGTTSSGDRAEKIAKAGAVVSAILASSCCWLPLLLLAVGVSGAGIASALEAYRTLFMGITFVFLGAAFYFTYRPQKSSTAAGHGCCATDSQGAEDCCSPAGGKFSMMSMNKVMLWVVTAMAVAFLLFPDYVSAIIGSGTESVSENMKQSVFKIEGMSCEGCAAAVATAIRSVPAVQAVDVSYEKQQAIVGSEICCPVPKNEILSALSKAGYTGTLLETAEEKASPDSRK